MKHLLTFLSLIFISHANGADNAGLRDNDQSYIHHVAGLKIVSITTGTNTVRLTLEKPTDHHQRVLSGLFLQIIQAANLNEPPFSRFHPVLLTMDGNAIFEQADLASAPQVPGSEGKYQLWSQFRVGASEGTPKFLGYLNITSPSNNDEQP